MNIKSYLKEIIDKATIIDFLIVVAGLALMGIASPYVMRQFTELTSMGDIFWNICWDVLIFVCGLLILMTLDKALKALFVWLKKYY